MIINKRQVWRSRVVNVKKIYIYELESERKYQRKMFGESKNQSTKNRRPFLKGVNNFTTIYKNNISQDKEQLTIL